MNDDVMSPDTSTVYCDNIKLNEFNQIQPHGGLLVLDKNLRVIQYSENIITILDTPVEQLLNFPVTSFLESENINDDIAAWLKKVDNEYRRVDWKSSDNLIKVWICPRPSSGGVILEIEPLIENDIKDNSLFDLTQHIVDGMKLSTNNQSMSDLIQNTCNEIQRITEFDRVIAYQFDSSDDSGIVIGEATTNNMESYLGLRFPATDIPKHVRNMYLNIPIRYIPTIAYNPVKIIPETNPITATYLDLSDTTLRMVAPVHIKYLTNMHVESAVSVAIIHNNRLWGIIACHHQKPRYLSINFRLVLMLIGNTLGIQVASLGCSKKYSYEQRIAVLLSALTDNFHKEGSVINGLNSYHKTIMELVGASGMSIYFQENILSYGDTPEQDEAINLIEWLKQKTIDSYFSTASLPLIYPNADSFKSKACGLLVIPITRLLNHYMIFYRPELIHSIYWAGNPGESLTCHGNQYSPRDSFERYKQTISDHAAPWTAHDIKSAEFIRSIVVNKQLQDLLQAQAMLDPLTGLSNRLYLDNELQVELKKAKNMSQNVALILADLDFFKSYNDKFGHQAGDYVLSQFAKLLKNSFKGGDYLYRYGGEEFLIILPNTNAESAVTKAEILRKEVKSLNLMFSEKKLPKISISAGIAVYPNNGDDGKTLIAAADVALYKAKETGRDKVILALSE